MCIWMFALNYCQFLMNNRAVLTTFKKEKIPRSSGVAQDLEILTWGLN